MKNSRHQCKSTSAYSKELSFELLNPDPRIREMSAGWMGWETRMDYIAAEVATISAVISLDCMEDKTLLGGRTVSLLEDAALRLVDTAYHRPPSPEREKLLDLLESCVNLFGNWTEKHGLTPANCSALSCSI